jgi:hypothetical protein
VNALVVNDLDLDMALSDEVLAQLAVEDYLTTTFCQLSLNAISGTDEGQALKVRALVNNQVMLTLFDSGSSHSFVNSKFLKRIGVVPLSTMPKQVCWGTR